VFAALETLRYIAQAERVAAALCVTTELFEELEHVFELGIAVVVPLAFAPRVFPRLADAVSTEQW
jgi:hypothetical protein